MNNAFRGPDKASATLTGPPCSFHSPGDIEPTPFATPSVASDDHLATLSHASMKGYDRR